MGLVEDASSPASHVCEQLLVTAHLHNQLTVWPMKHVLQPAPSDAALCLGPECCAGNAECTRTMSARHWHGTAHTRCMHESPQYCTAPQHTTTSLNAEPSRLMPVSGRPANSSSAAAWSTGTPAGTCLKPGLLSCSCWLRSSCPPREKAPSTSLSCRSAGPGTCSFSPAC